MKAKGISLIIGADGLIGRAMADYLVKRGERLLETTRKTDTVSGDRVFLDLTGNVNGWKPPCQVSVAYLCAAMTSQEQCHKEPVQSAIINVHHTVALARTLADSGSFVIFPSSNLVYDGSIPRRKADDAVCPATEYGRQKAEAEKQLLALGKPVAIVRLTKVLDPELPLFRDWLRRLRRREAIHPYADMVMAPVSLGFTTNVLHRIAEKRSSGIFQVSAARDVTYEEIGRYFARHLRVSQDLVQPVMAAGESGRPEAIPQHTTLDITRLRTESGLEPPDVWKTIDSVFGPSLSI